MKKIRTTLASAALMLTLVLSAGSILSKTHMVSASESDPANIVVSTKENPAAHNFMNSRRHDFHMSMNMGEDVPGNGNKKGILSCPLQNNPNVMHCEM